MHRSIQLICRRMKHAVVPALLFGVLTSITPVGAVEPPLDEYQIRNIVSGRSASMLSADLQRIEVYFAPGGELRGRYKGDHFHGSWSVEDGKLCLNFGVSSDDACRTAVRIKNGTLQLFTLVGNPAGRLHIEQEKAQGS